MINNVVGSLDLIKRINRKLVLEAVKNYQPISRAQIAKRLKISKTTVVAIANDLVERRLLIELGEGVSGKGGGRPGMMLGFNPKSAYGIGVDVGGTKIQVIITDLVGEIILNKKFPTTGDIHEIVAMVNKCLHEVKLTFSDIIGMGIGIPGTTKNGVVIRAKSLGWANYDFQSAIRACFPFPVFVNNDVRFASMGERWLGSGQKSDNLFFIAIGTGIGSAIICGGELVSGQESRAGEICYQTCREDMANNRFNVLGKTSVFEEKVSGTALSRHNHLVEELFRLYGQGDKEVDMVIKDFVVDLSVVIANAINLLDPEYVVIGGGVSESMDVVIYEIQDLVDQLTPIKSQVKLASLGGKAGALGAIAYTFEQVEQS